MGVVRKWVFPILFIIIFGLIAASLVKFAFFPDTEPVNPDVPGAQIVEPQVAVTVGTIQNDVTLSGTVAADAAVPVKATLAGEVRKLYIKQGQQVAKGTPILSLRAEIFNDNGTSWFKTVKVLSPAAGILSDFPALVGQLYSVGDDVGKVAPPTFHVTGSLAPEQLYRLSVKPTEAQVIITGGPAPFTCTKLVIATPLEGSADGSASGPTVTCRVPAEVTVFPGLTADIVIAGGIAENVLIVPTTAVEGIAESGNVYFVLPDGTTELRVVTLGLNDGFNVEIIDGLAEGDLILQYVPGAVALDPGLDPGMGEPMPMEECFTDDQGNTVCTGNIK